MLQYVAQVPEIKIITVTYLLPTGFAQFNMLRVLAYTRPLKRFIGMAQAMGGTILPRSVAATF